MKHLAGFETLNNGQLRCHWKRSRYRIIKGKRVELDKSDYQFLKFKKSLKGTWVKIDMDTRRVMKPGSWIKSSL